MRHILRYSLTSKPSGRECVTDAVELTLTRAQVEPPHMEAVSPTSAQAPAGNLKVSRTHGIAKSCVAFMKSVNNH